MARNDFTPEELDALIAEIQFSSDGYAHVIGRLITQLRNAQLYRERVRSGVTSLIDTALGDGEFTRDRGDGVGTVTLPLRELRALLQ